ncbi:MAG: 4-hydroxy-3-methylbut-2-enyl diphosphate reductase [Flavobacterium sp.]|nr:4-hydroxy-3-methylbut-2-enyl diphosphate reductase [Flavobacterium sp.]
MKNFEIPGHYRSSIISLIKGKRKSEDPRKLDFEPTELNFGPIIFLIARHFGFCYGVENAIDIAYKTITENPGKRIFFLSEMIHNPAVNKDLQDLGIRFIMDNYGNPYIQWDEITSDDIVIIPAFGTTIEIENLLKEKKIDTAKYNTTCPFVEKVWNKANQLGAQNFTVVIHGKCQHEETRATFSHTVQNAPSVIIRDLEEAELLRGIISGKIAKERFYGSFASKYSDDFDVDKDLVRIGVVNQTTMLAGETEEIASLLRTAMITRYGEENIKSHFADTRDTLCYATNDNQKAVYGLMEKDADLALVIGGYNSSNTTHLVELLEKKFKTYFISSPDKISSKDQLSHFDIHTKEEIITSGFLPADKTATIAITSGASCPDSIVDEILKKILSFYPNSKKIEEVF